METCIQSTQKDGKLTADQALVKQAWERLSAGGQIHHRFVLFLHEANYNKYSNPKPSPFTLFMNHFIIFTFEDIQI